MLSHWSTPMSVHGPDDEMLVCYFETTWHHISKTCHLLNTNVFKLVKSIQFYKHYIHFNKKGHF
jgi:hypothetical protein